MLESITLASLLESGGTVLLVGLLIYAIIHVWNRGVKSQEAHLADVKEYANKLAQVAESSATYMKEISGKIEASKRRDE